MATMSRRIRLLLIVPVVAALAAPLAAQRQQRRAQEAPAAPVAIAEPKLVLEREVFHYPGRNRRDPFVALSRLAAAGPQFADMSVRMIVFSEIPGESLAVIRDDNTRRSYRLRRGDVLGDATIVEIGRSRVVFSVDNLGVRRRETLELRPNQPSWEPPAEPTVTAPPPPDTTSGGGSLPDPNTPQGA
jgi:hypothetical protein